MVHSLMEWVIALPMPWFFSFSFCSISVSHINEKWHNIRILFFFLLDISILNARETAISRPGHFFCLQVFYCIIFFFVYCWLLLKLTTLERVYGFSNIYQISCTLGSFQFMCLIYQDILQTSNANTFFFYFELEIFLF